MVRQTTQRQQMLTTHNLGFPRIGENRELKSALEQYWRGELSPAQLENTGANLRRLNWNKQAELDRVPVGDFSFYDQVLDMSFTLGNIPERACLEDSAGLNTYFRVARGRSADDKGGSCVQAGEMTKWFDSNYHYIVPEFDARTTFSVNSARLFQQIGEARGMGLTPKPVLIGPVTYLWLGKANDATDKLSLLPSLLKAYAELLNEIAGLGIDWIQLDEPILVTQLPARWRQALLTSAHHLKHCPIRILLTSYFGSLHDNLPLVVKLPVAGIHIDAINAHHEIQELIKRLPENTVLSLGVIDGRNVWKTDLNQTLDWLEPIYRQLQNRLWLAPSCSLLHVPIDLELEKNLAPDIRSWLAFAVQKISEVKILAKGLENGRDTVSAELTENRQALESRRESPRIHNAAVQTRTASIDKAMAQRRSTFQKRAQIQHDAYKLPLFPTTTIGSFPQTKNIRLTRKRFRTGELDEKTYKKAIRETITECIRKQEKLELDVLVHGEAERNDMVEYFGEHLQGFTKTENAWVQSYGSRCVKPPIIYGDIFRPEAITVEWSCFAQSLTDRPVKGMLTGPVTILNWSFVRDDQPEYLTCRQLALAIRDEVLDLEKAGIGIIQIDEAALREGLPLKRSEWDFYLDWAVQAFRIAANGVQDKTQIHSHMCYSEFNDIIEAIAEMDADVITIESSRSGMKLLECFDRFHYPNDIGPGVYDIHTPNIPSKQEMQQLAHEAASKISIKQLWINPDCGLKTREWPEVEQSLINMVAAAKQLRIDYQ